MFLNQHGIVLLHIFIYFAYHTYIHTYMIPLQLQIKKYEEDGTLAKVHLAFSRDTSEKVYVQHLMKKNKADIWKVLEEGGHIYVCG